MERARDPFAAAITVAPQRSAQAKSWPAIAALALGGLSLALLPVALPLSASVACYAVAALLAPALVVFYRVSERTAQQSVRYVRRQLPRRIAVLAVAMGLLAGAGHAWLIATELAKR